MSVVDHREAPEVPWRQGYRRWKLAGGDTGFSCTLDYSEVEPGAGAPPHYHNVDEFIVVLEGTVEARLGDEVQQATRDHTVAIPSGMHHSFRSVGPETAKILVFLPAPDLASKEHTTYLND